MRILLVKLGSIGDIVCTLPALAAIRAAMPEAHISWAVEERSAEILRDNPMIDNLIEVDTQRLRGGRIVEEMLLDAGKQIRNLRRSTFDIAIDFQGLWKSALVAKLSGAPRRVGFSRSGMREPASRILITETVKTPERVNVVRKNLALATGALRIAMPASELEYPLATNEEHIAEAEEIAAKTGGQFAVLNPGGGWVTKLWHAEKFGGLADALWERKGLAPVVVTGPQESELAEKVRTNSRSGKTIFAQPSLKGLYEIAKRSQVFVGGDTGPTHIAVAAGAPVVGLFGPTEWWFNGSANPRDVCVERDDIACRIDCNRRTCSKWICMDSDVAVVLAAVEKRMNGR